jgi:hypothetical protein
MMSMMMMWEYYDVTINQQAMAHSDFGSALVCDVDV